MAVNRGKRSIAIDMARPEAQESSQARRRRRRHRRQLPPRRRRAPRPGPRDHLRPKPDRHLLREHRLRPRGLRRPSRLRHPLQASTGMVVYEQDRARHPIHHRHLRRRRHQHRPLHGLRHRQRAVFPRFNRSGPAHRHSLFASGLAVQTRPCSPSRTSTSPVREGFLGELAARRKDGITYEEAAKLHRSHPSAAATATTASTRPGRPHRGRLPEQPAAGSPRRAGVETRPWTGSRTTGSRRRAEPPRHDRGDRGEVPERTTAEWTAAFDTADVPCAPAHFPEELFDNPHVAANDLLVVSSTRWQARSACRATRRMSATPPPSQRRRQPSASTRRR